MACGREAPEISNNQISATGSILGSKWSSLLANRATRRWANPELGRQKSGTAVALDAEVRRSNREAKKPMTTNNFDSWVGFAHD